MSEHWSEKVISAYRDNGLAEVAKRAWHRARNFIYESNSAIWFKRDLYAPVRAVPSGIPLTITFTDFAATLGWVEQLGTPWMLNPQELKVAKEQGHLWVNARDEGKIVAYIKLGFKDVYIVDYKKTVAFPQNVAFIYDTYVLPELRGHKIASHFVNELALYLKSTGYTTLMCHIPGWNIASIKTYERIGFLRTGEISCIKLLNYHILSSDPVKMSL
ncbi:GNAT family N-acetyltransferase [bacterium]|nr:GNAT family N-acetyltransferase [bacterium]